MAAQNKQRLDAALAELYPSYSRTVLQSFIMQGKVTVDGKIELKSGASVKEGAVVSLNAQEPKYVSRAGFKLEAALEHFGVRVEGLVAMDAGISTGGFTHCLLQNGIKRVYGIDVGVAQVDPKVTRDERVRLHEGTNLRLLTMLPEPIDIATLDLSFISVLKVMPAVSNLLAPVSQLMVLIKPQFEADRHDIRRGGVVTDPAVHQRVIASVVAGIETHGFKNHGVIESPIKGAASGNTEFLAYFTREAKPSER